METRSVTPLTPLGVTLKLIARDFCCSRTSQKALFTCKTCPKVAAVGFAEMKTSLLPSFSRMWKWQLGSVIVSAV